MKKFFTILTFFLFISLNAHSLEKAIFPFTIDEQVQDYKEDENIISIESKELNSDKYWNTPLTRLDYILFQLKKAADKNQNKLIKVYSDGSSFIKNTEAILDISNEKKGLDLEMTNSNRKIKSELKRIWYWSKK